MQLNHEDMNIQHTKNKIQPNQISFNMHQGFKCLLNGFHQQKYQNSVQCIKDMIQSSNLIEKIKMPLQKVMNNNFKLKQNIANYTKKSNQGKKYLLITTKNDKKIDLSILKTPEPQEVQIIKLQNNIQMFKEKTIQMIKDKQQKLRVQIQQMKKKERIRRQKVLKEIYQIEEENHFSTEII